MPKHSLDPDEIEVEAEFYFILDNGNPSLKTDQLQLMEVMTRRGYDVLHQGERVWEYMLQKPQPSPGFWWRLKEAVELVRRATAAVLDSGRLCRTWVCRRGRRPVGSSTDLQTPRLTIRLRPDRTHGVPNDRRLVAHHVRHRHASARLPPGGQRLLGDWTPRRRYSRLRQSSIGLSRRRRTARRPQLRGWAAGDETSSVRDSKGGRGGEGVERRNRGRIPAGGTRVRRPHDDHSAHHVMSIVEALTFVVVIER